MADGTRGAANLEDCRCLLIGQNPIEQLHICHQENLAKTRISCRVKKFLESRESFKVKKIFQSQENLGRRKLSFMDHPLY